MHDLMLQCAGIAAIAVALLHSVLGETKVFARATIEPARLRSLIHGVWQCSTVDWIGGGILLIVTPLVASEAASGERDDGAHGHPTDTPAARSPGVT